MIVFSSTHPLILLFSFLRYKSAIIDSLLFIIDPLCLYSHSFSFLYTYSTLSISMYHCGKPQDCTTNDPLCYISIVTPASAILTANVRFRASSDTHC